MANLSRFPSLLDQGGNMIVEPHLFSVELCTQSPKYHTCITANLCHSEKLNLFKCSLWLKCNSFDAFCIYTTTVHFTCNDFHSLFTTEHRKHMKVRYFLLYHQTFELILNLMATTYFKTVGMGRLAGVQYSAKKKKQKASTNERADSEWRFHNLQYIVSSKALHWKRAWFCPGNHCIYSFILL